MKPVLLAFTALIVLSSAAFAAAPEEFTHIAVCKIGTKAMPEVDTIDLTTAETVNPLQLGMINEYLQLEGGPFTWKQIRKMMEKGGSLQYDDLYFNTYAVAATGKVYVEVKSYPGDNPYSFIFTPEGELVATNSDDSIDIVDAKLGNYACPWEESDEE